MRRTRLFTIALLFLAEAAFSQIVNFFTPEMHWTLKKGISLENGGDFEPATESVDLSASLDLTELYFSTGFKLMQESSDFTTESIFWPTFFSCLNMGIGTVFHINYMPDNFIETDFLFGFFAKYTPSKRFSVASNMMYMRKTSRIFITDSEFVKISNDNMALALHLLFLPTEKFNIAFDFSSYSYYRYMLFFAPDFRLELSYKLSRLFAIGSEVEVQYIDMFTLSANFNSANFRCFVKMEF